MSRRRFNSNGDIARRFNPADVLFQVAKIVRQMIVRIAFAERVQAANSVVAPILAEHLLNIRNPMLRIQPVVRSGASSRRRKGMVQTENALRPPEQRWVAQWSPLVRRTQLRLDRERRPSVRFPARSRPSPLSATHRPEKSSHRVDCSGASRAGSGGGGGCRRRFVGPFFHYLSRCGLRLCERLHAPEAEIAAEMNPPPCDAPTHRSKFRSCWRGNRIWPHLRLKPAVISGAGSCAGGDAAAGGEAGTTTVVFASSATLPVGGGVDAPRSFQTCGPAR